MDEHLKTENFKEYSILAAIIAVVLLLVSLFIALTASAEADFSLTGIAWIFRHNTLMWLVVILTVMLPGAVWYLSHKFTNVLSEKKQIIHEEKERIDQVNEFTQQLIHDNLDVEFNLSGEHDVLGETLINLRNALKTNQENNLKLRKAEEQRNWLAEGSAHFSEILRNYIHEPDQLSFFVIKDLTKYVDSIQGGFYLLDDSDPHNRFFNLAAFFAYDRRKFTDQKIKWGDGLIGTCALEQKTIHLKSVPESYISVTSGLGEANPNNLIVVPMMYEGQIYGVLELASLKKFESNHIALIEKTADSVAATLSAIKTNQQTTKLLEESKAQTHTLTSHEEEMRQNMEELQATQEEAMRQSQRLVSLENTLAQSVIIAELDDQGRFLSANNLFFSKFEYGSDLRIEGKQFVDLIDEEHRDAFKLFWNSLISETQSFKGNLKHITRTGKDLWVMASLHVQQNEYKGIDRIMYIGMDSSEDIINQQKKEAVVNSINHIGISLEFDINGNLLNCNQNFIDLFKLTNKDIKSLVVFDIINPIELEGFNKRWDNIIRGTGYTGLLWCKTPSGEELWLNGSITSTLNASHETDRVIFAGTNITHEKMLEVELTTALETLKKQEKLIKESEKELSTKMRETKAELLAQYKEVEKVKNLHEKMLDDTADAIIATSHDNRIIFFNKAAELLWHMNRKDLLNQDIGTLFPESLTEKDELIGSFTRPGDHKITGTRKKSLIIDKNGKEKPVLVLLAKAKVENENAYMAFFQPL